MCNLQEGIASTSIPATIGWPSVIHMTLHHPELTMSFMFQDMIAMFACAESDTTYKNTGAIADLYSDTKTKGAMHFFDAAGEATWIIVNPSTGAQVHLSVFVHFLSLPYRQALEPSGAQRRWLSQPTLVWRLFTVVLIVTAQASVVQVIVIRRAKERFNTCLPGISVLTLLRQ